MLFLLANWRWVLIAALSAAIAVQEARVRFAKYELSDFKQRIEVENAQERARIADNGRKAVEELQTRLRAANERYKRLRGQSNPAPSLADTGILKTCPGEPVGPDTASKQVERLERGIEEILRFGDDEIAKYVELYKLNQANGSVPNSPSSGATQ